MPVFWAIKKKWVSQDHPTFTAILRLQSPVSVNPPIHKRSSTGGSTSEKKTLYGSYSFMTTWTWSKKKIIKQCQTWQPNIELKTTTKCLTHVQSMDLLWASDTRKVNHAWRIQSFLLANWQAHSEALFIKKGKMHCRHCAWENCYLWKIGTKE